MKSIKLVNLKSGESVAFGESGFVFDSFDIAPIAAIHKTYGGYSQNGVYRISSRLGERRISLAFHIKAASETEMDGKKRQITRITDPVTDFELYLGDRKIRCCAEETAEFSERREHRKGLVATGSLKLLCLSPCFYGLTPKRTVYGAYAGLFTFPASVTEKGSAMGYMPARNTVRMSNRGDIAVGMTVAVTARTDCEHFRMAPVNSDLYFLYDEPIPAGARLTVCTEYGEKSVRLLSGGVESSALQFVDPESTFLPLETGDNIFVCDCGGGECEIVLEANERYLI